MIAKQLTDMEMKELVKRPEILISETGREYSIEKWEPVIEENTIVSIKASVILFPKFTKTEALDNDTP